MRDMLDSRTCSACTLSATADAAATATCGPMKAMWTPAPVAADEDDDDEADEADEAAGAAEAEAAAAVRIAACSSRPASLRSALEAASPPVAVPAPAEAPAEAVAWAEVEADEAAAAAAAAVCWRCARIGASSRR